MSGPCPCSGRPDALQQRAGWLIRGVLGYKLAAKGLLQDALAQPLRPLQRRLHLPLQVGHHGQPLLHLAAVQLLRGLVCVWDVRPDEEADAVRARRHILITTLADLADLAPEQTPADPPTSREEWQHQQDALETAWPWRPTPRELALLQQVAADHASISREVCW